MRLLIDSTAMPHRLALIRAKQLSMAATARVIWLCAWVRLWPYGGVGKCASVMILVLSIQHIVYGYLDSIVTVRQFVYLQLMDFTKAFDSINHSKLPAKFRSFPSIFPESIGTIASCLPGNSEFPYNNHFCNWKAINRGTTQGRVSGSFLYI